jgi:predicted amidophosphoribosyltransferase
MPEPAGFGNCKKCIYFTTGPAHVCQKCAARTLQPPEPYFCVTCGQSYEVELDVCVNPMCRSPERVFAFNRAIAMKTGPLEQAIWDLKFKGRWGWGIIFARVLLGYLDVDSSVGDVDLVIPMPMYNPDGRPSKGFDHAGWVIENAIDQDYGSRFPFRVNPPVVVKSAPTRKMVQSSNAAGRREISEEIYAALTVPDPSAVEGLSIVVFDDVFTGGNTLNAVARRLTEAGARQVAGLTMARSPWR